jgi:hypothetical protein
MSRRRLLRTRYLDLPPLFTLSLNLLLRGGLPFLPVRKHLLPDRLSLRLLLLPQGLSLALLLLHLLAHAFALRLLGVYAICTLLLNLLPAQILYLLSRVSITASCLSRQIGHLPFSRLFRGQIRLLVRSRRALALRGRRSRSAFVLKLNLLIPDAIGQ